MSERLSSFFARRATTPVVFLLIAIICGLLYFNTLPYGYSLHDDDTMISLNMDFIGDASNLGKAFVTDAWCEKQTIELYRPLQTVTYILDAQTSSDVAMAAHRTNIILHVITCCAVFILLGLLGFERPYALAGSLVYAVHYLFSHAVIWIPARGDLLLALFSVLSMITFIRLQQTGSHQFIGLNALCFALAIFSKETAAIIPVLSAVYAWLHHRDLLFARRNIILIGIYSITTVVYLVLRSQSIAPSSGAVGPGAIISNLPTIPETLAKLVIPINYSTMPFFSSTATLIGTVIMVALGGWYAVRKGSLDPQAVFGICWFVLLLLPSMVYRPTFSSFHYEYLDHRAYLPAFGLVVLVLGIVRSISNAVVALVVFGLMFVMNAAANYTLHRAYESPLAFAQAAISADDRSALAHFLRGNQLYQKADSLGAMRDFTAALDRYPQFHEARYNRALLYQKSNNFQAALEDLTVLLSVKPDYSASAWETRAIIKATLRDGKGANEDFQQALRMEPQNPKIQRNYSVFKSTLNADPNTLAESDRLSEQGIQLAQKGQLKEALSLFQRAAELSPNDLRSRVNIGNCLHAMGDLPGACRSWKQAAAGGNRYAQSMVDRFCK